jgi:hypothetical protein
MQVLRPLRLLLPAPKALRSCRSLPLTSFASNDVVRAKPVTITDFMVLYLFYRPDLWRLSC